jgi:ABC-type phosphate/phosphonate transport system substrate-binding protein
VPGTEALYDELWRRLRLSLENLGYPARLPASLERGLRPDEALTRADLLFTQTCGFDIARKDPPLTVIGALAYGGRPGTYTSYLVVREDAPWRAARELRGLTLAANDPRSYSGYHVWRQWIPNEGSGFFGKVNWTGSHLESLRALREGSSQTAAVDSVTYSLLRKFSSSSLEGIRVLAESKPAPAPPLVTLPSRSAREVRLLRDAFSLLFRERATSSLRAELGLSGFFLWREEDYARLMPEFR